MLILGSMAEKAVVESVEALRSADLEWSQRIIEEDQAINNKRFDIEERAIFVIASQQPLASDLRVVMSALMIITDLERIGDHAEGIARINLRLGEAEDVPRRMGYIPAMADRAIADASRQPQRLRRVATSTRPGASAMPMTRSTASRTPSTTRAFRGMIANPATIERNTYYLWTAHNLERIADRCTNICERVIYLVTGRMEEINVSKY